MVMIILGLHVLKSKYIWLVSFPVIAVRLCLIKYSLVCSGLLLCLHESFQRENATILSIHTYTYSCTLYCIVLYCSYVCIGRWANTFGHIVYVCLSIHPYIHTRYVHSTYIHIYRLTYLLTYCMSTFPYTSTLFKK